MVGAITDITVREGINPRDSQLVVGGGATGSHICEIASELGIRSVLIPRFAAGLSAYGGLISDIRWEEQGTALTSHDAFSVSKVNVLLARLRDRGGDFLARANVPSERRRFEYSFLGRYRYQSWEIEVPLSCPKGFLEDLDGQVLADAFHAMHYRIYNVKIPTDIVEFTSWKVKAIGLADVRTPARLVSTESPGTIPTSFRPLHFRGESQLVDCPVFDGSLLAAGAVVTGPAVIEEPTTTILVTEGSTAIVDPDGNYHLTVMPAVERLGEHFSTQSEVASR